MFLKSLKIEHEQNVIRDISFHKGINLIVDETETIDQKESGNNVGKTTAIRLIDFCLGGKGKNIYQDREFKNKANKEVEDFLKQKNIVITLILKEDLDITSSKEIVIRRNFLSRKDKIQEINGESISDDGRFKRELKKLIFKSENTKPTFRQLIAKNIRDEDNRLVNAVKVLHSTTTFEEYESLYLFWLGIDLDEADKKQKLLSRKKMEEDLQKRLKKKSTPSQVIQALEVVKRSIKELEKKKNSFNLNENHEKELSDLNAVKSHINSVSSEISQAEMRRTLILESKDELEREHADIDSQRIGHIYKEAKGLNPKIQKTFEETLRFHNTMISEKVSFITEDLPVLEEKLQFNRRKLNELLKQEDQLTKKLNKSGAISELQEVISDLTKVHEQKGALEELNSIWKNSNATLEEIMEELTQIDQKILGKDDLIQERIAEFNKYFSTISKRLYSEQFILSSESTEKGYELNISSISGNLGTGKKKGQIAAFDLAYIQFADASNIEALHFIIHDQIETVHGNQILTLLTDIINEVNCQYIAPVLKDKLPQEVDVSPFVVLKLSQNDKLFRI